MRWRLASVPGGLAVRWAGPRDAPAVVLLHGFLSDGRSWTDTLATADLGTHRWLAVDLPGHGRSADVLLAGHPQPWTRVTELLDQTLAQLGIHAFVLVGYSAGARIAAQWALSGRTTHGPRLKGLLLESGHPGLPPDQRPPRQAADAERARRLQAGGLARFVADWEQLPLFASQAARRDLALALRRQRAIRLSQSPGGLVDHLQTLGTGAMPCLDALVPCPDLPTAVLTGALDPGYGLLAAKWRRVFPQAEHTIAAGAGHNVHLEAPQAWAAAVQSLWT